MLKHVSAFAVSIRCRIDGLRNIPVAEPRAVTFDLAVRHRGPEVNLVEMETCPVDSALRSTAQTQHIDCKGEFTNYQLK